jgi:hypothetical protein
MALLAAEVKHWQKHVFNTFQKKQQTSTDGRLVVI